MGAGRQNGAKHESQRRGKFPSTAKNLRLQRKLHLRNKVVHHHGTDCEIGYICQIGATICYGSIYQLVV